MTVRFRCILAVCVAASWGCSAGDTATTTPDVGQSGLDDTGWPDDGEEGPADEDTEEPRDVVPRALFDLSWLGEVPPPPEGYERVVGGTFEMGSPPDEVGRQVRETQHTVTVTRDFWLKKYEVTQAEWFALMGTQPSRFAGCDDCPVEQVSWWEAVAFCNALSVQSGLTPCYEVAGCDLNAPPLQGCATISWPQGLDCTGYRLPTEAEWELAARAGTAGPRYADVRDIAWYSDNGSNKTHPVGQKLANAWGLYDMLGNVWEWTWDWYADYPTEAVTDPLGPATGSEKAFRGGSWIFNDFFIRAANRNHNDIDHRGQHLGFRPARTAPRGE